MSRGVVRASGTELELECSDSQGLLGEPEEEGGGGTRLMGVTAKVKESPL